MRQLLLGLLMEGHLTKDDQLACVDLLIIERGIEIMSKNQNLDL